MIRYLVGRVLQTLLSMLVVISIVFVLTRLSGNPVHLLLDVNATQRDFDLLTRHLGLDKPLPVQYGIYVKNIVQGDFGKSVLSRRPVIEHIRERLPATVELGIVAMLLSVLIGVPIGVYSAVRRGGVLDSAARVFAVLGQSLPPFWLGLMLILVFGVILGVLPAGGRRLQSHRQPRGAWLALHRRAQARGGAARSSPDLTCTGPPPRAPFGRPETAAAGMLSPSHRPHRPPGSHQSPSCVPAPCTHRSG